MKEGFLRKFGRRPKEASKEWMAEQGLVPNRCGVKGCDRGGAEYTVLKPLDPIDHDEFGIQLCEVHRQWAEVRNALAEEVTEKLREARKEIGQEHLDELQELADPRGTTDADYLMGENGPKLERETE